MKNINIYFYYFIIILFIQTNLFAQSSNKYEKLAQASMEHLEYDSAIIYFSKAILKDSKNADYYTTRGICYAEIGNYNKALIDYKKALSIKKSATTYIDLALVELNLNKYPEALATYKVALSISVDKVDSLFAYYGLGFINSKLKKYPLALEYYNKALLIDSLDLKSLHGRAVTLFTINNFKDATIDFNKLDNLDSGNIEIIKYLAKCFNELGQWENAIKKYSFLINKFPEDTWYLSQRAGCYHYTDSFKNEIKDYTTILYLYKKYECRSIFLISTTFCLRGVANAGDTNYQAAINDYDECLKLNPKDGFAYTQRAFTKYLLRNYQGAIEDFTELLKIDNENTEALFNRALSKTEIGDRNGAINDYDQIIKKEGKFEPKGFLMATVYNNKGYCLVELEKYNEALPLLNKAIELGPDESYIWGSRGELFYKQGDYTHCISDMNKGIELLESKKTKATDFGKGEKQYYRGLAEIKLGMKNEGCADLIIAEKLGELEAEKEIKLYCK